jgi:hypothetical protein
MASAAAGNKVSWEVALLDDLKAKVTPATVKTLIGWQAGESGNGELATSNNPLNTELDSTKYPDIPGTSVPEYPNLSKGVSETAATITGSPAFAGLLSALRQGVEPTAAELAPWDPGSPGYGANIENDIASATPNLTNSPTVATSPGGGGGGFLGSLLSGAETAGSAALDLENPLNLLEGAGSGAANSLTGDLFGGVESWIKGEAATGLAYIVLTFVGLAFVIFGVLELFGYSPKRVAGNVAGAVKPAAAAGDIPF